MATPNEEDRKRANDIVDWADPYDPDYDAIERDIAQALADTREEVARAALASVQALRWCISEMLSDIDDHWQRGVVLKETADRARRLLAKPFKPDSTEEVIDG